MKCRECITRNEYLSLCRSAYAHARKMLVRHGDGFGGRYVTEVANAKVNLQKARDAVAEHAEEAHGGEPPKVKPVGQGFGSVIFKTETVPEGKVKCGVCGTACRPIHQGRKLRRHSTPQGDPCPNTLAPDAEPIRVKAPPVVLPPERKPPAAAPNRPQPRDRNQPSRLDAGSNCRECGKWLPGERSLCGRCYVRTTT